MDAVPAGGEVLDLYAGVGLFAVALAAAGREGIVAVEGDRESGADLLRNAAPYRERVRAAVGLVEDHLRRDHPRPATLIVDPPRTGISREAMDAIPQLGARRIVYVSCDPPTMARDARRLLDAGYRLGSLTAFDLFPNTPHVEAVGVFER
jgi:tRNA/tmRNA/rRNA uracil-C5-methylase (TrmA/RlmC/RlmD family)